MNLKQCPGKVALMSRIVSIEYYQEIETKLGKRLDVVKEEDQEAEMAFQ